MTDQLQTATRAYQRAQELVLRRRAELAEAIAAAAHAGTRQSEIVAITGYTREHIRRIVRDAGA